MNSQDFPKGTREIAEVLGMRAGALNRAIWEGRCPAPLKGPGGAYLWMPEDGQRAAWALRHRSWETLVAEHERAVRHPACN